MTSSVELTKLFIVFGLVLMFNVSVNINRLRSSFGNSSFSNSIVNGAGQIGFGFIIENRNYYKFFNWKK